MTASKHRIPWNSGESLDIQVNESHSVAVTGWGQFQTSTFFHLNALY